MRTTAIGLGFGLGLGLAVLGLAVVGGGLGGCGREDASAVTPATAHDSVRDLLLAIDAALAHGSAAELEALLLETDTIVRLCPELAPDDLAELRRRRAKRPPADCVALTDWAKLERKVPQFPAADGLNVGTRVCDERWKGCPAIARMCKSEIFYVIPETPDAGFKVNVNQIVEVEGKYWLMDAPRCMAKGSNAKR